MADTVGKQRIKTVSPAGASIDVNVGVVDSTGANNWEVNASGQGPVDIAAQSLTAVAVSADNAANAAGNPIFTQLSDGTAAVGDANPLAVNAYFGDTAVSTTDPLPVGWYDSAGNELGTASNPVVVSNAPSSSGTTIREHFHTNGTTIASGATDNQDYVVPNAQTATVQKITFSCPAEAHLTLILDPATADTDIITLHTSPGSTTAVYEFVRPVTLAGDGVDVIRTEFVNDDNQGTDYSVMWEGFYVAT